MLFTIRRVTYSAGDYRHRAAPRLQVRLVRRGSSYVEYDVGAGIRRSYTRPGDLIVSLPGSPTYFHITDSRELTVFQLHADEVRKTLRRLDASSDDLRPLLEKPVRDVLVAELMRRLEDSPQPGPAQDWAIGLLMDGLLRASKSVAKARRANTLTPESRDKVLRYIDGHLDERLRVEELAQMAAVPRRVFASGFARATGLPVHQYILRKRADLAVRLLKSTKLPIPEIALRAGFAHQAHLTRVVGRLTGKTPRRYRTSE